MPIYRPSELLEFLRELNTGPKKSLSQNFLIDGNILKKITALAELKETDVVIEIGPGPGALTEHMLSIGCRVIAIEKDKLFADALKRLNTPTNTLEVHSHDALTFPFDELFVKGEKAKVVANIPYSITSELIEKIVEHSAHIKSATLMVQEEAARRFLAKEKTNDFGYFTIFLQLVADVQFGFLVPQNCFYPAPKVNSAVILLDFEKAKLQPKEKELLAIIKKAFSMRRKMLKASLKEYFLAEQIEDALKEIGKESTARPEELSVDEWLQFYRVVKNGRKSES